MPKINRETAARPLVNGDSWWLPQPREGFTAYAAKLFDRGDAPPTAMGVSWQQMAKWDQARERKSA